MKITKRRLLFPKISGRILLVSLILCTLILSNDLPTKLETISPLIEIMTVLLQKGFFYSTILRQIVRPISECGEMRHDDGYSQKVISFSLFLRNNTNEVRRNYVPGIVQNLKQIRTIYPGWVMRIYTDIPENMNYLAILQNETDLFICNVRNLPRLGDMSNMHEMVWRFLPIGDPTVKIFMVRDLDSVVTIREQRAVAQWENSWKIFHTMRDSPYHHHTVMGGLWGAKNYLMDMTTRLRLKNQFIKVGRRYYKSRIKTDQDLLDLFLYRPFSSLFMVHDSYLCLYYNDSIPFPTERDHPMRFVGMKSYEFGLYDPFKCNVACRPSYGKNWTYC